MDKELFDDITETLPKFNPDIAKGYAVKDMADSEEYIHRIAECAAEDFPEGLEFVNLRLLTPREEFRVLQDTKARSQRRREIDIAQTDVVMAELKLRFGDQTLVRNINIPFMREAGTIYLSGSRATIHPILADLVFSVVDNGLFVILFRAKFTLKRANVSVIRDGESLPAQIIWGNIYQGKNSAQDKTKGGVFRSSIGHYLFCKMGVTEVFRKYYNSDIIIDELRPDLREQYPIEDYVIFQSQKQAPIHLRRKPLNDWKPTNLVLIVPRKDVEKYEGVTTLAAHFFYVVDQYPERFDLRYIDLPGTWRIVMGFILHKGKENEGKLLNEVDKHLRSLDSYVDRETRKNFAQEGIDANDIYDLFIHVIDTIRDRIQNDDSGNMWGKYLLVKRYALSGITESIFNFTWQLEKEKTPLQIKRLNWKLAQMILTNAFMAIQRDHGELNSVQYPGDCMIFKHTCIAIRQVNAVTGKKTKSFKANEPAYQLHSSIFECASICNFAKGIPDGRGRLNMTALTTENGRFIRNPKNIELLDQAQLEIENATYNKD